MERRDAEGRFNTEIASIGSRRETHRSRADNAILSLMNPVVRLITCLISKQERALQNPLRRYIEQSCRTDGNNEAILVIMLHSYGKLNTLA